MRTKTCEDKEEMHEHRGINPKETYPFPLMSKEEREKH
jgi:hypothetical protein